MGSAAVKVSVIVASCSTINCAFIPVAMDREATMDEALGIRAGPLPRGIHALVEDETDFEAFFAGAPAMNPLRDKIKGVVCGVRVEEVEEDLMREIRYLDKLIDELAKGKAMTKILRA